MNDAIFYLGGEANPKHTVTVPLHELNRLQAYANVGRRYDFEVFAFAVGRSTPRQTDINRFEIPDPERILFSNCSCTEEIITWYNRGYGFTGFKKALYAFDGTSFIETPGSHVNGGKFHIFGTPHDCYNTPDFVNHVNAHMKQNEDVVGDFHTHVDDGDGIPLPSAYDALQSIDGAIEKKRRKPPEQRSNLFLNFLGQNGKIGVFGFSSTQSALLCRDDDYIEDWIDKNYGKLRLRQK